ncbi:hypothetical protein ACGFMM_06010 [Streptomyces sp. NPDC048604]|uniref:hypothetical protein n=1 Tax=Streptomyces sp. NPDC048604 TaxID=3365578 RepID=UPI003710B477
MFAYELHRIQHADLVREAAAQRLAHEAARTRRNRNESQETEGRVSAGRHRFARAA